MLKLSKSKQKRSGKCKCTPNCNRTRESKHEEKTNSPDLHLEIPHENNTCTLLPKSNQIINQGRRIEPSISHKEGINETTYLKYAELAKRLGAWDAVKAKCASCNCGTCCPCLPKDYALNDVLDKIYKDMKAFDLNVRENCKIMRIMYDNL